MRSAPKQRILYFLIFGLFFFVPFLGVSADIINPENSISLSIQPTTPEPSSQVDAIVESYLFDLNKSKISWTINGSLKQTGIGKTAFSFTTGALGKTTTLGVAVDAPDGTHVEKELSLQSANVDLAWQAYSYTPPFYEGKSLFPVQGTVKVVALPDLVDGNGVPIASDKLIYKWTQDGEILGDNSGYGQNNYAFSGDIFSRPVTIKVEVSSLSGNQTAEKTIVISPTTPQTVLYEDDPLFGIKYERSLPASFSLTNPEIKINAVPYFFNINNSLTYSWDMNGNPFTDGQSADGKSVILRQNGQTGTALISLSIKNNDSFLQSAGVESSILLPTITPTNAVTP
ncbi:MAG: hypothetical protein PHV42_02010 [Candidatus Pacebacteria bacterium]|nr:hypothetical protein [Candidatus Paceibacterota bacterium]